MIRPIFCIALLVAAAFVLLDGARWTPTAEADLPPSGACPEGPSVPGGSTVYRLEAPVPGGGPFHAVCVGPLIGTGGENKDAAIITNPGTCGAPVSLGASTSTVWASWDDDGGASGGCASGGSLVMTFRSSPFLCPDVCPIPGAALWHGSEVAGNVTITRLSVGGIADFPDEDALANASSNAGSSGLSSTTYGALAGVLVVGATALATGGWFARRRLRR